MRVLLCHRLNLGDLVCASPGIQWLKARHPDAVFRLVTNDFAANVGVLIPEVEQVLAYRKFGHDADPEWRQLLRARSWKPERVIGLSPSPDSKLAWRLRLFGSAQPTDFTGAPRHAAERLAWVLGWRGAEPLPAARLRLPGARGRVRDVAIWVSARKPSNRPSAAQVVGVVRSLRARRKELSIGVFGLPPETESGAHLPDEVTQSALAEMLAMEGLSLQTPSLSMMLGELAASASLIAPDGGMAHVAAGFGKAVVALFGEIDPAAWRPWSPRARNLQAASREVTDLSTGEIVAAWEEAVASAA